MTAIRGQGRRTARSLKIAPIIALIHATEKSKRPSSPWDREPGVGSRFKAFTYCAAALETRWIAGFSLVLDW